MTEVIRKTGQRLLWWSLLASVLVTAASGQQDPNPIPSSHVGPQAPTSEPPRAGEQLYLQLRGVGLDPGRVYQVRDASLDHDRLHISLEDGTVAFTTDVYGRVTGAFFEGEGEILLIPPDQGERASMALFTGAAILEEKFATAYFRFNDDTFAALQPGLRPAEDGKDFAAKWNETARNLAQADALRLFMSFSRLLPVSGRAPADTSQAPPGSASPPDRYLHARVQGEKLGGFDVIFDSNSSEQITVAQLKPADGVDYYNIWTAFSIQPPSGSPAMDEQDQDEVAIRSYVIRAEVRPPTELQAEARVQLEMQRAGSRALLFELSRFLKVSDVKWGGQSLEVIQNQALEGTQLSRRGNDLLAVIFPQPLRAGQKIELRFAYRGDVLSEAGGGLLYVGARGTWYPNRGMAPADFDLQFHYPLGWTLLATGTLATAANSLDDNSPFAQDGEQVGRWIADRPIPVAGFNLGKYSRAVAQAGNVAVETYAAEGVEKTFPKGQEIVSVQDPRTVRPEPPEAVVITPPPPSPAHNAQAVADAAARAVQFYGQRFGPYPYSTLELTQMPGPFSQGWPGLVFLSSYAFLTKEERSHLHLNPADETIDQLVTAHETAHQWWGDLVSWRTYRDQWISEGLSNYSALMLLQEENPSAFRTVMQKYRDDLVRKNKEGSLLKDAGPVTLGARLSSSEFPRGYEAISYGRGTWLFHMLRCMLDDTKAGDLKKRQPTASSTGEEEPFVRALRRVRERYAGKAISSRELIQVFAEELPPSLRYEGRQSLDWFYDSWVKGTALPHLELQGVKFTPREGSVVISGTLLQKDVPKDTVTSVPLYGQWPGERRIFLGRVFADGTESTFRLVAPAGVRRVLIDPEQTILTNPH